MSPDDPAPSHLVRPYALTRGRTAPTRAFSLETLLRTGIEPLDGQLLSPEELAIAELCRESRSVAEVAALVRIPIGVARVLIGDLVERGVLRVLTKAEPDSAPGATLLERVLSGLRKL